MSRILNPKYPITEIDGTKGKVCSEPNCRRWKPITEFSVFSKAPDGLQYWCKECMRIRNAIIRDPVRQKAYDAARYAQNPEANKAQHRRWVKANPDRDRQTRMAWRKAHPERNRANSHRRRAAFKETATEDFTSNEIFERDDWMCGLCKIRIDSTLQWPDPGFGTIDHIKPIARGGDHTRSNVQAAHLRCNLSKGART